MQNKKEWTDLIEMKNVYFSDMDCELRPYYSIDSKTIFPFWVEMERVD